MTNDERRGPGRPRREDQPDVLRQPLAPEGDQNLEVQEEAERQRAEARAVNTLNAQREAEDAQQNEERRLADLKEAEKARKKAKKSFEGPTIEVLLTRKYVPTHLVDSEGDLIENTGTVLTEMPAGTTLKLPKEEAVRAINLGVAQITSKSFDG